MTRKLIRLLFLVLAVLCCWWLLSRKGWLPSPFGWLQPKEVLIENTPMLVKEIRQIGQLISLNAQDEVVVSALKPASGNATQKLVEIFHPLHPTGLDRLVLVVKGELLLGTELKALTGNQVFVSGDSVSVTLPAAAILEVQINPLGTTTFIEEGVWTPQEVTALKGKAREKLVARAHEKRLAERANQRSLLLMENFLKTMGFKKITVLSTR